jgi:hypothetical protein
MLHNASGSAFDRAIIGLSSVIKCEEKLQTSTWHIMRTQRINDVIGKMFFHGVDCQKVSRHLAGYMKHDSAGPLARPPGKFLGRTSYYAL